MCNSHVIAPNMIFTCAVNPPQSPRLNVPSALEREPPQYCNCQNTSASTRVQGPDRSIFRNACGGRCGGTSDCVTLNVLRMNTEWTLNLNVIAQVYRLSSRPLMSAERRPNRSGTNTKGRRRAMAYKKVSRWDPILDNDGFVVLHRGDSCWQLYSDARVKGSAN